MQIVIVDDDPIARRLGKAALESCGMPFTFVEDGVAAWHAISARRESMVVVLDRQMPGMDGLDVARLARQADGPPLYIVMVTSAGQPSEITEGLEAGADDYVVKPFNQAELRARVRVGMRILALQESLASRVTELEAALANVKELKGLLPICAYCKKVRVDEQYWQQVEGYVQDHTDAQFTHGICPSCFPKAMGEAS